MIDSWRDFNLKKSRKEIFVFERVFFAFQATVVVDVVDVRCRCRHCCCRCRWCRRRCCCRRRPDMKLFGV